MKTTNVLAAMCCVAALVGCGEKGATGAFAYEEPVDLSNIIEAYEQYLQNERGNENENGNESGEDAPYAEINMDMPEEEPWLVTETSFVLRVPEYAGSEQPFLAQTEDFYNSSALAWNVWSNYEVWLLGHNWGELICDDEEIRQGIEHISVDVIRDSDVRTAAQCYKDSLLKIMETNPEYWDEGVRPGRLLDTYQTAIADKSYSYYDDREVFAAEYDSLMDVVENMTRNKFQHYLEAKEDSQVLVMLNELSSCQDFDEQCSLWLNWTNCKKSEMDDEWIVAVGAELMKSSRYSPMLHNIWITWRAIVQGDYYGNSRGSVIPNVYYNGYRRRCYITCLKRIESHPDDVFAMNSASVLGGHTNMNRYGRNYLGNESMIERALMMPKRYEDEKP